jgi:hypothetical protein
MRIGIGAGLAVLLTAACGTTGEAGPMPVPSPAASSEPPLSSTELPTRPPAKPKTPSDLVPSDMIAGRVTRGGSGPCYGLVTDDGIEYALYSAAGMQLGEGTFVRVRFEPLLLKIYCGPGRPVSAVEITVLR